MQLCFMVSAGSVMSWKTDSLVQHPPSIALERNYGGSCGTKGVWFWSKTASVQLAPLETRWSNTEQRRQFLSTYFDYKKNAAASMLRLAYTI